MKRPLVRLACASALVTTAAVAARARATSIEDTLLRGLTDTAALMDVARTFTEAIGPRLTGSPALIRAQAFAVERFRAAGVETTQEAFTLPITWARATVHGELTVPYRHVLQLAQLGWTPPTAGTVVEPLRRFAPRSGPEMEAERGKLRGAIVLMGEPATELEPLMMVLPLRLDPKGAEPPRKASAPSLAERVAFLHAEGARAFLLDAGKPEALLDMTDLYEAVGAGTARLPGAIVIHDQYVLLWRLAEKGVATVSLRLDGRDGPPAECVNTVASIPGVELPHEVVLVGAHLDSWDLGTGATDNAAGASAVVESARLLAGAGARPRRTIRFVLFSGEEQGLLGSKAYVSRHRAELDRHSAVFILDTGTGRIDGLALQGRAEVEPILKRVLEPVVPLGVIDTDLRLEWGSDHLPFDEAGVPAFCFEQVQHDYSRTHHSQIDTFEKLKPADLQQAAVVLALTAFRTAQLPALLPRRPPKG